MSLKVGLCELKSDYEWTSQNMRYKVRLRGKVRLRELKSEYEENLFYES